MRPAHRTRPTWTSIVGSNTLAVTVTAMDTTTATLTYTITVTRAESGSEMLVPGDWSLVPTGLSAGDSFRLLFLSSTRHDASSASIDTYNDFVQGRAANGHTDIQAYSDGFTVVGCTEDVDARDNTGTTFTNADRGIPIYWLNGNKVANEYRDFYDGSWDDEANDKNQSGNNGPDTSDNEYYPLTGCDHNGTGKLNSALGSSGVTVARPNSPDTGHGPLSSGFELTATNTRPMYGISAVFTIVELSNDAKLSDLTIGGTTDGERFTLSPRFDEDTFTYTAEAATQFDAVTLTATTNQDNATVVITNDDNPSTPDTADLDLEVGDNTLTVTVTAEDPTTTETYTITVTRAATVSTDATLSDLTIEDVASGETVRLSPPFRADTTTYAALVAHRIDAITLTATKNNSGATVAVTDDDTNTLDTADLNLDVGDNTLTVTVTAEDTRTTETYTIIVTRAEPATEVPITWGLIPSGFGSTDQFRLIFISSNKRQASAGAISNYNTWIQDLAANGHADIQAYSAGFRAVGCTKTSTPATTPTPPSSPPIRACPSTGSTATRSPTTTKTSTTAHGTTRQTTRSGRQLRTQPHLRKPTSPIPAVTTTEPRIRGQEIRTHLASRLTRSTSR